MPIIEYPESNQSNNIPDVTLRMTLVEETLISVSVYGILLRGPAYGCFRVHSSPATKFPFRLKFPRQVEEQRDPFELQLMLAMFEEFVSAPRGGS